MLLFSTNPTIPGIGGHVQVYNLDTLPVLQNDPHYQFLLAFNSQEWEQHKDVLRVKLADHWTGDTDLIDCISQGVSPQERWSMFSFSLPSVADSFQEKPIYIYRSRNHRAWVIIRTDLLNQLVQPRSPWWEQGIAIGTIYQQRFQGSILDYCERIYSAMNAWEPADTKDAREKKRIVSRFKTKWAELGASEFFGREDHMRRHAAIASSIERTEAGAQSEVEFHVGSEGDAPVIARTSSKTPAGNLQIITELISSAKIAAVFDPYLDSKGLNVLGEILSLGVTTTKSIKILTAMKAIDLPKGYLDSWLSERELTGELRRMPKSEHSRFFLLNNKKSLRMDVSLNSLKDHNAAAHLDPIEADSQLFESLWATSKVHEEAGQATNKSQKAEKQKQRLIEDWQIWKADENDRVARELRDIGNDMLRRGMFQSGIKNRKNDECMEEHSKKIAREKLRLSRELEDLGYSGAEIAILLK